MTSIPEAAEPVPDIAPATDASRLPGCSGSQQTHTQDHGSSPGAVSPSAKVREAIPKFVAQASTTSASHDQGTSNEAAANVKPHTDSGPTDNGMQSAHRSKTRSEDGSQSFATNRDVDDAEPSNISLPGSETNSHRTSRNGDARLIYRQKLELLSEYLPHLHRMSRTKWDCDGAKPCIVVLDQLPGTFFSGYSKVLPIQAGENEMEELPSDADRDRVIIVEDLFPAIIELLDSSFKLNPELFASHLDEESPYDRSFGDLWNTAALSKRYCSIQWWRPVHKVSWSDMIVSSGSNPTSLGAHSMTKRSTNVFRREFQCTVKDDLGFSKDHLWRRITA